MSLSQLHAVLKHMSGKHNQKRHGWRYGSATTPDKLTPEDLHVWQGRNLKKQGSASVGKSYNLSKNPKVDAGLARAISDLADVNSESKKREKLIILDGEGQHEWDNGESGSATSTNVIELTGNSRHMLHNHPHSVDYFTDGDTATLLSNPQLETSTIVTKTGLVHHMRKTDGTPSFDYDGDDWPKLQNAQMKIYSDEYGKIFYDPKLSPTVWDNPDEERALTVQVGVNTMKRIAELYNLEYSYEQL